MLLIYLRLPLAGIRVLPPGRYAIVIALGRYSTGLPLGRHIIVSR